MNEQCPILIKSLILFVLGITVFISPMVLATEMDDATNKDINEVRASFLHLESNDSIYAKLTECLDKNGDTRGIDICYEEAYKAYDVLLNKVYKLALASMGDSSSKNGLRLSQRKWLEFRDQEFKLHGLNWKNSCGTIIGPSIARHTVETIRERIAELSMYAHYDQQ